MVLIMSGCAILRLSCIAKKHGWFRGSAADSVRLRSGLYQETQEYADQETQSSAGDPSLQLSLLSKADGDADNSNTTSSTEDNSSIINRLCKTFMLNATQEYAHQETQSSAGDPSLQLSLLSNADGDADYSDPTSSSEDDSSIINRLREPFMLNADGVRVDDENTDVATAGSDVVLNSGDSITEVSQRGRTLRTEITHNPYSHAYPAQSESHSERNGPSGTYGGRDVAK